MSSAAQTTTAGSASTARERQVWELLAAVPDPEIPVLSIVDLGIVRYVHVREDGRLRVGLTPTYSGCPATEAIRALVRASLAAHGYPDTLLEEVLAPAWSSAWLSDAGRRKLEAFGIAPPEDPVASPRQLWQGPAVRCPRCAGTRTERVSEFGSTPCKAHYRCLVCAEPFDYFKCI